MSYSEMGLSSDVIDLQTSPHPQPFFLVYLNHVRQSQATAVLAVGRAGREDPKSLNRRLPWPVGKLQRAVWRCW